MSYLDDLKGLEALGTHPTKPTKEGFVGFVGRVGGGVAEIGVSRAQDEGDHLARSCSWRLAFGDGYLDVVAVPAISREQLYRDYPKLISCIVAQSCGQCLWHIKPGQTELGYCSSPDRRDQQGPFGAGHPASYLPEDGGTTCEGLLS